MRKMKDKLMLSFVPEQIGSRARCRDRGQ